MRLVPVLLAACALATALPAVGAGPVPSAPREAPDLFKTLLGKGEAEVEAKIQAAHRQLFEGDPGSQAVYFPVGGDEAYIADIANHDVRSEGMSYGLMLAVQMDRRDQFDRLWRWAVRHMRHDRGPRKGLFAWHCTFDGRQLSEHTASDGEEWFAMALLFAANRWGHPAGAPDYEAEAQALLRVMLHKGEEGHRDAVSLFDPERHQVVFVPNADASGFTDPSYHLPAFYELWARWAEDARDRAAYARIASVSRAFFHRAASAETGLMPDYATFAGEPCGPEQHRRFSFDAWRTLSNVALDHAWWDADGWQVVQSNRVLRFLASQGPAFVNEFELDGRPVGKDTSTGLYAMAAAAGLAADPALAKPFVQRLWDLPVPSGTYRYYDGLLYELALLEVSGRFRPWPRAVR